MAKEIVLKVNTQGTEKVEKTVNAFIDLKTQVREAKGELAGLKVGTAEFDKAQRKVAELTDKLGDLKDAAKVNGTGVEKLSQSFSLLTQSLGTADLDKAKLAFGALKGAMSALPIFALIAGIQLLVENFGKVVDFASRLTGGFTENQRALKELNNEVERQITLNEKIRIGLDGELKLLIAQGAPLEAVRKKKEEIYKLDLDSLNLKLKLAEATAKDKAEEVTFWKVLLISVGAYSEAVKESINDSKDAYKEVSKIKNEIQTLNNDHRAEEAAADTAEKNKSKEAYKKYLEELKAIREKIDAENKRQALERQAEDERLSAAMRAREKKDAEDAAAWAKLGADAKADVEGKAFEKTIQQGIQESKFEQQAAQRTLEGKLDALYLEKQAQLASIGDTESAAAAKAEIELQYLEKVNKAKEQSAQEEIKRILNTANQVAAGISQAVGVLSAFGQLQQAQSENDIAQQQAQNEQRQAQLDAQKEQRINSVEDEKNRSLTAINDQYNATLSNSKLSAEERQKIEARKNKALAAADRKAAYDKQVIEQQIAKQKYQSDLAVYNAEEKAKEKAFEQDKAFRIVQTIVAGAQGIIGLLASPASTATLGVAGGIAAAALAATTALQVGTIKAQKYKAGSAPQAPALPSISIAPDTSNPDVDSASDDAGPSARPNRATLFSTGQSQRASFTPGQDGLGVIKAYVVSSEMTNQQQLDATIASKSSF